MDANTKLLIHFDGADGATTYTAETGQTVSFVANAALDDAQKKFGATSLLLDGTGDYTTIPDSDDWNLGSGDFTLEVQVRFNTSANPVIFIGHDWASATRDWMFDWLGTNLTFRYTKTSGGGEVAKAVAWTPSADTWYHVAVVRSGANLYFFVDGSQVGATQNVTGETIFNGNTGLLNVGGYSSGGDLSGWIDEVRFSNVARWTENFTAPTSAYETADGRAKVIIFN